MPPRQSSPNARGNRRRPSNPGMPGGWLWLIIVVSVLAMIFIVNYDNGATIDYSDFWTLVQSHQLKKVTFMGNDRIFGEVKDRDQLPEELKGKLKGNRFNTNVLQVVRDNKELIDRLDK